MNEADFVLQHQLEQFYFREARLLDDGRFREWLALFSEDARYWMPVRETRATHAEGIGSREGLALFDDDKAFLTARVDRLDTGLAHAEQPPSRTRHSISNIEIVRVDESVIEARCNIMVFQSRLERSECLYVGYREDAIRISGKNWCIVTRKIVLDQPSLPRSISIFF